MKRNTKIAFVSLLLLVLAFFLPVPYGAIPAFLSVSGVFLIVVLDQYRDIPTPETPMYISGEAEMRSEPYIYEPQDAIEPLVANPRNTRAVAGVEPEDIDEILKDLFGPQK